jgi:hypothetical protein
VVVRPFGEVFAFREPSLQEDPICTTGECSIDISEKVTAVKEAKINGQNRKGTRSVNAESNGAEGPVLEAATSTQSDSSPANRSDWLPVTFRAPPDAKKFLAVLCAKRDLTIQTLGLQWLQSLGAPVCDADLDDDRKKNQPRARVNSASAKNAAGHGKKAPDGDPHEAMPNLSFLANIAKFANGHGAGQAAPVVQVYFVNVAGDSRSSK